jgi:hypothetical protein
VYSPEVPKRSPLMVRLTVAAAVAVGVVTALILVGGGGPAKVGLALFLGGPLLLAAATFALLWRLGREGPPPTTVHQYPVSAPGSTGRRAGELLVRLSDRGYQLEATVIGDAGDDTGPLGSEEPLLGAAFRLRERRADPEAGGVVIRLHKGEGDSLRGLVEAIDAGPGLYDEMANFVLYNLGELIPELEFQALGQKPGWLASGDLAADLPAIPLGLQLL